MGEEDLQPEFMKKRVLRLAIDIGYHLHFSFMNKDSKLEAVFARSSIACSAVLLEAIANLCIFSLLLPRVICEDIDKLRPIAKLEFFLFALGKNRIDRRSNEIKLARQVLQLRNFLVHPKVLPDFTNENGSYWKADKVLKNLGLSPDDNEWKYDQAKNISDHVLAFIAHFFSVCVGFDKHQTTLFLTTSHTSDLQGLLAEGLNVSMIYTDRFTMEVISEHISGLEKIVNISEKIN